MNTVVSSLSRFKEPVLIHADNPHERMFIAALDGTGNDAIHDPEHATNVALIARQIERGWQSEHWLRLCPRPWHAAACAAYTRA